MAENPTSLSPQNPIKKGGSRATNTTTNKPLKSAQSVKPKGSPSSPPSANKAEPAASKQPNSGTTKPLSAPRTAQSANKKVYQTKKNQKTSPGGTGTNNVEVENQDQSQSVNSATGEDTVESAVVGTPEKGVEDGKEENNSSLDVSDNHNGHGETVTEADPTGVYSSEPHHHHLEHSFVHSQDGETDFMKAAFEGRLKDLEKGVNEGLVDLNQTNDEGDTIAFLAAYSGHLPILIFLSSKNYSFGKDRCHNEYTPLLIASERGHKDVVEFLLKHGSKITEKSLFGDDGFHLAAYHGHYDIVVYLHDNFACQANNPNFYGDTALILAASNNSHTKIVNYLITHCGADIYAQNKDGDTALHVAASNGHLHIIQYFTEHELPVEVVNNDGDTPFLLAVNEGHLEIVKHLLSHYPKYLKHEDRHGNTALVVASCYGHISIIEYLLNSDLKNEYNLGIRKALELAVINGQSKVVEYLLPHTTSLHVPDEQTGSTPLKIALKKSQNDIAKILATKISPEGIGTDLKNHPFCILTYYEEKELLKELVKTHDISEDLLVELLSMAISKKNLELFEFLISVRRIDSSKIAHLILNAAGVGSQEIIDYFLKNNISNLSYTDQDKNTPLLWAAFNGQISLFPYLVNNGSSLKETNTQGDNALLLAANIGNTEIIHYILYLEPSLLASRNTSGDTPVTLAATTGQTACIEIFHEHGCDLLSPNQNGDTALHLAALGGHLSTVEFLLSKGSVDPNIADPKGNTALILSVYGGHKEVAAYLLKNGANPLQVNREGENAITVALALHNRELLSILADSLETNKNKT